jgi:nucleoside-diphosphate-sugar epimerase
MHVAVIGAAGMIGRKLTNRLVADGRLGETAVDQLTLVDVITPPAPTGWDGALELTTADLSVAGAPEEVLAGRPDVIFHLAAIVSGEAEADFEKGYRVNLDGTRALLEAIRAAHTADGYRPRLVFTSSLAVYGAPFPNPIPDDFHVTPLSSYGAQKAIGELLLNDYTRLGFVDGIGIRLPTICIRPGKPNQAASSFYSSILREPLVGLEAVLPVRDTLRHWFASPRAAVGFLLHAAALDGDRVGSNRILVMPGLSATVAEEIEALRAVAGDEAVRLIRREPDEAVMKIVESWAPGFEAKRARELGFVAESSFEEIIRVHIEDELGSEPGSAPA